MHLELPKIQIPSITGALLSIYSPCKTLFSLLFLRVVFFLILVFVVIVVVVLLRTHGPPDSTF